MRRVSSLLQALGACQLPATASAQRRGVAQLVGWHSLDEGHQHNSQPPPAGVLDAAVEGAVKTVYFIRHGQSTANAERVKMQEAGIEKHPEIIDPHLTELGRQQHEHHVPMEVCVDAIEYFPWLMESTGREVGELAECEGIQSLHRARDVDLSGLGPTWWDAAGDVARLERLRSTIASLPAEIDTIAVVTHYGLINLMHDDNPRPDDPVFEEMPFVKLPNTGVVKSYFTVPVLPP